MMIKEDVSDNYEMLLFVVLVGVGFIILVVFYLFLWFNSFIMVFIKIFIYKNVI